MTLWSTIEASVSNSPWGLQPGETSRAYALFSLYRDAGPLDRSYPRVASESGRALSTITDVAQRHSWVARARAWDAENEQIKRHAQITGLEQLARRQVLAGQLLASKGLQRVQAMSEKDVADLSIRDAIKLVETGLRLERLGRGEPAGLGQPVVQPVVPVTDAETALIEIMRRNPSRVGPVVNVLIQLRERMATMVESSAPEAAVTMLDRPASLLGDHAHVGDTQQNPLEPIGRRAMSGSWSAN